jgi:hypothetical protein
MSFSCLSLLLCFIFYLVLWFYLVGLGLVGLGWVCSLLIYTLLSFFYLSSFFDLYILSFLKQYSQLFSQQISLHAMTEIEEDKSYSDDSDDDEDEDDDDDDDVCDEDEDEVEEAHHSLSKTPSMLLMSTKKENLLRKSMQRDSSIAKTSIATFAPPNKSSAPNQDSTPLSPLAASTPNPQTTTRAQSPGLQTSLTFDGQPKLESDSQPKPQNVSSFFFSCLFFISIISILLNQIILIF